MSDHYLIITIYIDAVFIRHDVILLHLALGLTGRVVKQDTWLRITDAMVVFCCKFHFSFSLYNNISFN